MNPLGTIGALTYGTTGYSSCMQRKQSDSQPSQSIVKTLDNFFGAVSHMKDVVMVPNRLKDISAVVLPSPTDKSQSALALVDKKKQNVDLLTFYELVHTVENELVNGAVHIQKSPDTPDAGGEPIESIPNAFRDHLKGLFGILQYLTDTANSLAKNYQEEVTPSEQ